MSNAQNNQGSSDHSLGLLVVGLIMLGLSKNIDRIEIWIKGHLFSLAIIGVGLVYALVRLMRWRWKMKHPELYERELAIKQMQLRKKDDSFF